MKEKDLNKPKDIFKQPGAPGTVNILIHFCFSHGCLIFVCEMHLQAAVTAPSVTKTHFSVCLRAVYILQPVICDWCLVGCLHMLLIFS